MVYLSGAARPIRAAAIVALWCLSLGGAYRCGRYSSAAQQLRSLKKTFAGQIDSYGRMIERYDQLAHSYSKGQRARLAALEKTEDKIHAYLETAGARCTIDARGVQLINALIAAPAAAGGAQRAPAVPAPGATQGRGYRHPTRLDRNEQRDRSRLPRETALFIDLDRDKPKIAVGAATSAARARLAGIAHKASPP